MNKTHSGRGGARNGAGRPPVPTGKPTLKNWTVRVHEEEKQPVRDLLKSLRKRKCEG